MADETRGMDILDAPMRYMEMQTVRDLLDAIGIHHQRALARNERLAEENLRLRDEAYAHEELRSMQERVRVAEEDLRRGFPISEAEREDIVTWQHHHDEETHCDVPDSGSGISGRWRYEFLPTSIGVVCHVVCTSCGERHCFRDLG